MASFQGNYSNSHQPQSLKDALKDFLGLSDANLDKHYLNAQKVVQKSRDDEKLQNPDSEFGGIWSPKFKEKWANTPKTHDKYQFHEGMILAKRNTDEFAGYAFLCEMYRGDESNNAMYDPFVPHDIINDLNITPGEAPTPKYTVSGDKISPNLTIVTPAAHVVKLAIGFQKGSEKRAKSSEGSNKKRGKSGTAASNASSQEITKVVASVMFFICDDKGEVRVENEDGETYAGKERLSSSSIDICSQLKLGKFKVRFSNRFKAAKENAKQITDMRKIDCVRAIRKHNTIAKIEKARAKGLWPSATSDDALFADLSRAFSYWQDSCVVKVPFFGIESFVDALVDVLLYKRDSKHAGYTSKNRLAPLQWYMLNYTQCKADQSIKNDAKSRFQWIEAQYQDRLRKNTDQPFALVLAHIDVLGENPPETCKEKTDASLAEEFKFLLLSDSTLPFSLHKK